MVNFTKRKVKTLTLGEKLRKIREKSGISLAEIATHTKVKQEYLEKIESGDYDNLPFDVYVKGFLRSYAKYLDLDPKKVIDQFNREVGVRENVKKYQEKTGKRWENQLPNLVITPKMASVFFSLLIGLIGFGYFYLEVDSFSREPKLIIESPISNSAVDASSIEVVGKTDFENKITINNEPVFVNQEGQFKEKVGLQKGDNEIIIEAFNKFDNSTQKTVHVVADYELKTAVAGAQEKNPDDQEEAENKSFTVEIESREVSSWIAYQIDDKEKQSNTLHPGTILKIQAENQIEVSSGKASDTYVRINGGEFFPIDETINGFKKINLNKRGVILENHDEEGEDENNQ